jgi:serine/threonine protein kinase
LVEKGTAVLGAGTRLGEYEIERLLGVGSMGAVYEAVCTATSQRFAIKVLSPALAAMPTARARFLNEAKLTARVRHPHIVDVSDVGEDAGRSYFVMELLNGEDLSRRLQRSGRLSVVETADIIVPVCDAVAEAHRRGVTHRDLKPSNIFLLIRGRRPHPVVLDFGIAKEEDAARAPRAGAAAPVRRTVFGTPYYLAPEQVADHEAAGPASDQYALGVILYECLTGQPPYRGDNVDAVFRAIAAGSPAPPIALRPGIPQEMNAIVLRALSPDPKARYFSVGELRQALLPFSSKATGSVPTLQSRGVAPSPSPLSASPSPSPLSPSPSPSPSPPSEVEVQAPRSFVRTLTPEVEALEGAWFAAGEVPHESAGETAIPSPISGRESEWEPSGLTVPPVEVESAASGAASGIARLVSRRIWIGAAAGVAVVGFALAFALAFAMKSGRSQKLPTPAAALVQIEPTQAAPVPAAAPAAAPITAPTTAAAPSEAPAAIAPTSAPREAPVLAAPSPKEAPTAAAAPAPREEPTPAPSERAMPATTAAATAIAPGDAPAVSAPAPKRRSSDKPRVRASSSSSASSGVRMHNGVPLLD